MSTGLSRRGLIIRSKLGCVRSTDVVHEGFALDALAIRSQVLVNVPAGQQCISRMSPNVRHVTQ